eukprot:2312630-Rhodomonas_salina.1
MCTAQAYGRARDSAAESARKRWWASMEERMEREGGVMKTFVLVEGGAEESGRLDAVEDGRAQEE